ncbi:MAG: hypothetical protein RJR34_13110 [Candidatus Methanoculleus thermohydrogenotrophicum]|nr:hypothetical protein [Candidatus Methanoculleus thermohydrogenotrophicum]
MLLLFLLLFLFPLLFLRLFAFFGLAFHVFWFQPRLDAERLDDRLHGSRVHSVGVARYPYGGDLPERDLVEDEPLLSLLRDFMTSNPTENPTEPRLDLAGELPVGQLS